MTPSQKPFSPQQNHQKQMLLQVWLPLGVAILVILAVAVAIVQAAGQSSPAVSQTSNISIIFLLLPMIVLGLLYAFLVGFAVYGVAKLSKKISPAARSIQGLVQVISYKTDQAMNRAVTPLIKSRSMIAAMQRLFKTKL